VATEGGGETDAGAGEEEFEELEEDIFEDDLFLPGNLRL